MKRFYTAFAVYLFYGTTTTTMPNFRAQVASERFLAVCGNETMSKHRYSSEKHFKVHSVVRGVRQDQNSGYL